MSRVAISDLLVVFSAVSGFEDALAEAMYEELDYLVTPKEDLLGRPGGYLCLVLLGPLAVSPPLAVSHLLSNYRPHICPRLTEAAPPKAAGWPLQSPCEVPASLYTAEAKPVPAFLLSLTQVPWVWGGSFCLLCDVFLHIRVPVR